jgi:hypothetical protein
MKRTDRLSFNVPAELPDEWEAGRDAYGRWAPRVRGHRVSLCLSLKFPGIAIASRPPCPTGATRS